MSHGTRVNESYYIYIHIYTYCTYIYYIYIIYIHISIWWGFVSKLVLCMHLKGEQYYLYIHIIRTLHIYIIYIYITPHTEEVRLKIFGSPDYTVSPYNQGTPVLLSENLFEFLGTPVKTCLKVTGIPVKNYWIVGSRNNLNSDLLRLWCV